MPNACESLGTGWLYDSRIGVSLNGGEGRVVVEGW